MASGLPVAAYRSAAAAELVMHQCNGVVASPGDEEAYIAAALWTLAEPGRLDGLAVAARQAMLSRGWGEVVASFEVVAREALAG